MAKVHRGTGTLCIGTLCILNCSEFPNCCCFFQFTLFVDVSDMLTDISLTRLK